MLFRKRRLVATAALALTLLAAAAAPACQVPVFRYALDRWPADQYSLEVSATDAKDESVSRFLRNFTDSTPINVHPQRSKDTGASTLTFPRAESETPRTWSGALDSGTLPRLTDSPARTEIIHRILAGETAVLVLVESGTRETDDRTAAAVEKRLRYLEKAADIPPIDPDDPTNELGPGPALQVKFSLLRVRRDDDAEQAFMKMLAGPKNDQPPGTGAWLALVFGRGRVLGAWPAEKFGDEQIDEVCMFLLAACSCQVKRANPGWDLLLNVDWDGKLQAMGYPKSAEVPEIPSAKDNLTPVVNKITEEPTPKTETVTFSPTAPASAAVVAATAPAVLTPAPAEHGGRLAAIGAAVLLVVGGFLAWRASISRP
jgi:hypothetical protein